MLTRDTGRTARQPTSRHQTICALAMLATLALGGCASSGLSDPFAPAKPTESPKPAGPPVNMGGRWLLASIDGKQCGMNFTAPVGANTGKVAPEGGCPGNFFTSRQWSFEQGALVLYDHKEQALARLAVSEPPGQFSGTAVSGIQVTLSR